MIDQGVTSILQNGAKVVVPASTSANIQNGEGITSILVEHCYISNSNDRSKIDSDSDIKVLAEMDGKGIVSTYDLKLKTCKEFKLDNANLLAEPNVTTDEIKKKYPEAVFDSNIIATGSKITIAEKTYETIKLGDVNKDGKVTSADYIAIKNYIMGEKQLDEIQIKAASMNSGEKVTSTNYIKVKNQIMGTTIIVL